MAKVLLINPPFNISKENYDSSISVGLLCLASYLDQKGIEVKIIDCVRQKDHLNLISQELVNTDLVGLSVMTTQIPSALEISKIIKDFNRDLPVIWGGLHPTFFPKDTASHDLVDIAVIGEGEETLLEIIQGQPLDQIKGIAFVEDNKTRVNPERPLLGINSIPLPNWNLIPREILDNLDLIPTHTSRGCPHRCTFCVNAIRKNRWRGRNSQDVLKDLEIIKNQWFFKDKPIRFWDEDFFVDKQRSLEIVQGMIKNGFNMKWETTIRADYLDDQFMDDPFLADLKKSGCCLLSFGAESGSDVILKKLKKGITVDQIINSARRCLKHGIIPQYSFMVGLPGETRKDINMTIKLIDQLIKLDDQVQILGPQAFRPYPGSVLYAECLASGWSAPESLEGWKKVVKDELNYLSPRNFPWLDDVDLVESLEAYVRFGAHTIKSALSSTIKTNKILKLSFILLCKIRWKLKFFKWPIEFKIARRAVVKT